MDGGRAVGVRQHARVQQRRRDRPEIGDVGAEIGERAHAQAQEAPVRVQRQCRTGHMVARLGVAEEALGPAAQPTHRPPQPARGPGHQDLLGVGKILHAEAAAEIVGENPQALLPDPENAGDDGACAVHMLAVDVEGVALGLRVVDAERAARLDGVHDQAVVDQLDLHRMGRGREGRLRGRPVAVLPDAGEVARRLRPELGRTRLPRLRRVHHRRQRRVVHVHQVRRVACGGEGLGHDHGHRLADMAHAAHGQHRVGRIAGGAAVRALQLDERVGDAGERAEPVGRHLVPRIDGEDAR